MLLHGLCKHLGKPGNLFGVFTLDHDPTYGFCPGVPQQDAPTVAKFGFYGCNRVRNRLTLREGYLPLHMDIDKLLREKLQLSSQFGQRLTAFAHDAQNLQGRQKAVARGAVLAEDEMPGLFSPPAGLHAGAWPRPRSGRQRLYAAGCRHAPS